MDTQQKAVSWQEWLPASWLAHENGAIWVAGYRIFGANDQELALGPKVIDILETRALFIFGKLRYFDYGHIQMVPGPNGIPTVTVNAVQHETPEGAYLLIVSPVKDFNVATSELESNQRICAAAGLLGVLQGRNLVAGWSGVIHCERKVGGLLERSPCDAQAAEADPTHHGGD